MSEQDQEQQPTPPDKPDSIVVRPTMGKIIKPVLSLFDYVCPEVKAQAAKSRMLCDMALNQMFKGIKSLSDSERPMTTEDVAALARSAKMAHELSVGLEKAGDSEKNHSYREIYRQQAKAAKLAMSEIKRIRRESESKQRLDDAIDVTEEAETDTGKE